MPVSFTIPARDLAESWVAPLHRIAFEAAHIEERSELPFVRLGDAVEIASGQYVAGYAPDGDPTAVPYLRVDNVRGHVLNLTPDDLARVMDGDADNVPDRCRVLPGDVVIARTGTLGKAVLATEDTAGFVLSQHVSRLTTQEDGPVSAPYLALYLNAPLGRERLIGAGSGSTRLELTHASLSGVSVPVPPSPVQDELGKRLLGALDDYYEASRRLDALRVQVDQLLLGEQGAPAASGADGAPRSFSVPEATLGDLWTPSNHRPALLGPVQEIEEAFECSTVGDLADVVRGKGTRSADYASSGVPFVRTSSLINGGVDPLPDHYANQETLRRYDQEVRDGDILFSIEGRIGMVAMLVRDHPVVYKNHIERVRLSSVPDPWDRSTLAGWLFLVLSSTLGALQVEANTVVQSTISGLASRLRSFVVPLDGANKGDAMRALGCRAYEAAATLAHATGALREVQADADAYLARVGAAPRDVKTSRAA